MEGRRAYGFVGVDVEGEDLLVDGHHRDLHLAVAGWNRTRGDRCGEREKGKSGAAGEAG
jgi:hypothetical protein